jgi:Tfp pilus assembly protein PilF
VPRGGVTRGDPDLPVVSNNPTANTELELGIDALKRDDSRLAAQHFGNAIAHDQSFAYAHSLLGLALAHEAGGPSSRSAARQSAQRAMDLAPVSSTVVYNRACVHALLGDDIEAISYLKSALSRTPAMAANARRDPDFERLWSDTEFHRLIDEHDPPAAVGDGN